MQKIIRSKAAVFFIAVSIVVIVAVTGIIRGYSEQSRTTNDYLIYKSENVEVALLKNNEDSRIVNYEWSHVNDEIAYTKYNVIIIGEVSNVRPVTANYEFMDTDVTDYMTIFDVKVSDVLACRTNSIYNGDTVTIGVGYNMEKYGEGLPIIEEGRSYMIFCYTTDTIKNDVLELSNYVDCWIGSPKDLFVEKIGDYYLSIDYFSCMPESYALSKKMQLTEEQIETIFDARKNKEGYDGITAITLDRDEMIVFQVLAERAMQQPETCWDLYCRSYLWPCSDLEEYVRDKALNYN